MQELSVAYAKQHFSEIMARVAYSGESFLVKRRGKPMVAIVSPGQLRGAKGEANPWLALREIGLSTPALGLKLAQVHAERKKQKDRWAV